MISQQHLGQIAQLASAEPVSEKVVDQLREKFPDIHFTYCMDDDVVAAKPVHEASAFNLYLIDSRNHCLCFTQDSEVATGVVLAEIEDEIE
jgi:hypothetical protein